MNRPMVAWLRLDKAYERTYQDLEARAYAATPHSDPALLWIHLLSGKTIAAPRADFETAPV